VSATPCLHHKAKSAEQQALDAQQTSSAPSWQPCMRIFLINLDRSVDRLAHMRAQLNGMPFERISAVDGSNDPPTAKGLTRFELACLESHKIAWRKFLSSLERHACFLEDDLHIWPGFAALVGGDAWIPEDAHSVKLDTYLQKVEIGERRAALGGRQVARLFSRHQSSAAYILTREGAARYLALTAEASAPADYALFPNNPRRLGLRTYQLCPAVAIQDHLLPAGGGGQAFATAMAGDRESAAPRRASPSVKFGRETARLVGQVAGLAGWTYRKALLRLETTTVSVR
jgi:glycosyl transferase, family 25